MRFALIGDKREEAQPKQRGLCPCCFQPVIAKCGEQKVNHWAHSNKKNCDSWWETETEWHRSWKDNYSVEWQEVVLFDERTGEKHIADVRTAHNLVIEFQHSHIDPQERISREKFYKNMVWIVDGTRLQRDYPRFVKGKEENFSPTKQQGFYLVNFPDKVFPKNWLESSVSVIFDFQGVTQEQDILWCLLPGRAEGYAVVVAMLRKDFVDITINRSQFLLSGKDPHEIVSLFANAIRQDRQLQQQQQRQQIAEHYMRAAQRKQSWRTRGRRF
ncbi:MAG: hypothetical protein LBU91_05830 [Bacteroidales bacterium]|jgi:hypothetical protein|nr:hypothetical protein [Bacteroidales bacterium]